MFTRIGSWLHIVFVCLSTVCTLIVSNIHVHMSECFVFLPVLKFARGMATEWARICRFRFALFVLQCKKLLLKVDRLCLPFYKLRTKIRILRLNYMLKLLYLLDKPRCLSVLDAINQSSQQAVDQRDRFESGHDVLPLPNDQG